MKALKFVLAGGLAAAALFAAAPASAQYYPGYGYGGNVVGTILNSVLGGGGYGYGAYGSPYGGYGYNSQAAVSQCTSAVQARLGGGYGYNGYGYGGGRVLGVNRIERRSNGGLTIRGVASSGAAAGYGYGYNQPADLTFKCKTDYRGFITDVDVDRANYGYNYTPYNNGYAPYNDPYAQYGYRRY